VARFCHNHSASGHIDEPLPVSGQGNQNYGDQIIEPAVTLQSIIGTTHVLLITAVFFGLAHYLYGSLSGLIGFLMTGFLAWLLGKSMIETRGFVWAWFIHFLADVVIFVSYAIAYVKI